MLDEFGFLFDYLRTLNIPYYLVGGAVRDLLLGQPVHDLDFVVLGDAPRIARKTANHFHGAYYLMDSGRGIARVLIDTPERKNLVLDFSNAHGNSLESDILARDFTINAIAYEPASRQLIDPLQGALHLRERNLVVCNPDSFDQDPIRVLRALRFSLQLNLRMTPQTKQRLLKAVPHLAQISGERQRDELYRLLELGKTAPLILLLEHARIFDIVLPEFSTFVNACPDEKRAFLDVCTRTVEKVDLLFDFIEGKREKIAETLFSSLIFLHMGRHRLALLEHLRKRLTPARSLRGLITLAGLYFPLFQTADPQQTPAMLSALQERIKYLAFSRAESQFFFQILSHSSQFFDLLNHTAALPVVRQDGFSIANETYLSRREIYRYFKAAGPEGIAICLLSTAWVGAKAGPMLNQDEYTRMVRIMSELFLAFFEHQTQVIDPPPLLSGDDLKNHLSIPAGIALGKILELLKEEQAAGTITGRQQAFDFVKTLKI